MLKVIENPEYVNSADSSSVEIKPSPEIEKNDDLIIHVNTIEKNYSGSYYYKGKIMTISNPRNVKLISSSMEKHGEQIFVIADRVNAIGAINASGFVDENGHGNGGAATGIVIEDGIIKSDSHDQKDYVAGLTKNNLLLTGYYSANELVNLDVKYAAGFKPQLIVNGKKMVTDGDGGWGIGPRTAIGQKEDGTIIFLVIDGRQSHSIGATLKEVQDVLYDLGVVNAMAMDGGSSSSMYFRGENITTPSSRNHIPRYLPNIWAVVPDEDQSIEVYEDDELVEPSSNN